MAWTEIASGAVQGTGTANAVNSPPFNGTGADLLIIIPVGAFVSSNAAPTDSSGNTWSFCTSQGFGGTPPGAQICFVHNPTVTSSMTVGLPTSANVAAPAFAYLAFSGSIASGSPLDVQAGNNSGATQPGSITPSQNNSLIISAIADQSTTTDSVNDGFTGLVQALFRGGTNYGGAAAYFIQATAAPIDPTWTSGAGLQSNVIVAFKPASGSVFPEALSDSVATSETFADAMKVAEALTDSAATADIFSPNTTTPKSTTDTVATGDTFGSALTVAEALADSVATADIFSPTLGGLSLTDSSVTEDVFAPTMAAPQPLSDVLATADSFGVTSNAIFALSFSDTIATADAFMQTGAPSPSPASGGPGDGERQRWLEWGREKRDRKRWRKGLLPPRLTVRETVKLEVVAPVSIPVAAEGPLASLPGHAGASLLPVPISIIRPPVGFWTDRAPLAAGDDDEDAIVALLEGW
jgi:hypothetical protein